MNLVDLRENLGWLLGSLGAVISLILGYLEEYVILGTLLGTAIGAGITYYVQTKMQKRAWKREYSIKIVEEVYGELFKDVNLAIQFLEKKFYKALSFRKWVQFQADYRYFMVDEKFRDRLSAFSRKVEEYNDSCNQLDNRILPKIMKQVATRVFGFEPEDKPSLDIRYKKKNKIHSTSPILNEKLRKKRSLSDIIDDALRYDDKSEISNVEVTVSFLKADRSSFVSSDLEKIKVFWGSCLKIVNNNETYQFIVEENEELLREAKSIKKELIRRIEEPWKI